MLDTIKIAETPEGVELKLTCAGFYVRSIAWMIDAFIQGMIILLLVILLPRLGDFGMGLFFIVLFFLHWLYPVFFEMAMQGQTPGKRVMKVQVLLIDGTMVNWGASLLRNLLRTVDFLPAFYALGVTVMLLSRDFRRLGDLAANTIVVYKRDLQEMKAQEINSEIQTEPYMPKVALNAKEQQTIVHYAERMQQFSPQRAEELASLARPLLNDLQHYKVSPASERLLGIANYIIGRR
ncbi:MAG: RDD family protein [Gammaproteobacteria bacterium]|nr:RDD family protein [Gammaproteobacteria bacterium]